MTTITTLSNNRNELRAQVATLTDQFLANGGQITKIPMGRRALAKAPDPTSTEKVSGEAK